MAIQTLLGIDLGGTKVEGAIIEYSSAEPLEMKTLLRTRIPTEKEKGYEHIIKQIKKLVDKIEEESGRKFDSIGIGTPGAIDPTSQLMKNSNTTALNGMPFRKDLQKALGVDLNIANDANCFALAEAKLGVVTQENLDADVVFGVIMGTGVGGGLVVNGKILNGRHGIGGEWGHNFLHESGGACYCGKAGCVETVLSGTGLQKFYKSQTGNDKSLKDIHQAYKDKSDEQAVATIERLIKYFGIGISTIVNMIDPDVIILGGGVGNIPELYKEGVESVKEYVFNPDLQTAILKPSLGDSAGVFGAALLTSNG